MSPFSCSAENCIVSFESQEQLEEHRNEQHGGLEVCPQAGSQRSGTIAAEEAETCQSVDDAEKGRELSFKLS